ncbi:unnamed protein product [Cuscuta campestris]|uniref:Uncharacterized protein n=1 Tax=Cuscuta campestris TaxID=132261 RepID=A0A484LW20_9ASTE|nr:unnamed protein product [Cuscuta campestris]
MPMPPRGIYDGDTFYENETNDGRVNATSDSWEELWSESLPHNPPVGQDERRKRTFEGESSQPNKNARTSNVKKGKNENIQEMLGGIMDAISKRNESLNEVTTLMKDMIKTTSNAHISKFDIGETMAKLCCLPNLSHTSPEFLFACSMIEDPQRRTIFFSLPDDTSRVEYIKFMYKNSGMSLN